MRSMTALTQYGRDLLTEANDLADFGRDLLAFAVAVLVGAAIGLLPFFIAGAVP